MPFRRDSRVGNDDVPSETKYLTVQHHPFNWNLFPRLGVQVDPLEPVFDLGKFIKEDSTNEFDVCINLWQVERILLKREKDRKRKALERALESEEQKNLRRERERLARAALRDREPLEKRLLRKERERRAKQLARAGETEEQRRIRLERNRLLKANWRKKNLSEKKDSGSRRKQSRESETEEQRNLRREKDRKAKALMRARETEKQRRMRLERNRISKANQRMKNKSGERSEVSSKRKRILKVAESREENWKDNDGVATGSSKSFFDSEKTELIVNKHDSGVIQMELPNLTNYNSKGVINLDDSFNLV